MMQVLVMRNSIREQKRKGTGDRIVSVTRGLCVSGTHISRHVPGEGGDWRGRTRESLCEFVHSRIPHPNTPTASMGLKGWFSFLADKQKTALCVSVISLPGLAAKLASASSSVELAPRSQCHTERAAFQKNPKKLFVFL